MAIVPITRLCTLTRQVILLSAQQLCWFWGGIALFGTIGGLVGNHIAEENGAAGWEKAAYIAGGVLIGGAAGGVGGYYLTPAVINATGVAGVSVAAANGAVVFDKVAAIAPTGQLHHILSNPIMNTLNTHPSLNGLFDRTTSVVQALTPEAHRGYQNWHRLIDQTMVHWLSNPANQNATPRQFWTKMYELYNTSDMIQRFGNGALNYIRGMMK